MGVIEIDPGMCTNCKICSKICPVGIILPGSDSEIPFLPAALEDSCAKCGHCSSVCPVGAITPLYENHPPINNVAYEKRIDPGVLANYMQSRRSVRNFLCKPVEKEKISAILEIARFAPSGMNAQPVRWLVVNDPLKVRNLSALTIEWMLEIKEEDGHHPLKNAIPGFLSSWDNGGDPVCRNAPCLVIAYTYSYYNMGFADSIISLSHIDIAAPAFGLGTCWAGILQIAMSSYQPLKEELKIPEKFMAQYSMMLGYPEYEFQKIPGREKADILWR